MSESLEQTSAPREATTPNTDRRTFAKASVAVAWGLFLGTTYVRPTIFSVSVYETAFASGRGSGRGGHGKGGHH